MAAPRIRIINISAKGAKVNTASIHRDITHMMRQTVTEGRRTIAKYPAQQLRKSRYRRTGTLKRSWSAKVEAGADRVAGEVGSNSNIAPYNRHVQGPKEGARGRRQLAMFRRAGWMGVDELEDLLEDKVQDGLQRIIDRLVR